MPRISRKYLQKSYFETQAFVPRACSPRMYATINLMVIVGWFVFVVYVLLFNLGWIVNCRKEFARGKSVTHATLATTLLMTITTAIFLFSSLNKLHLFWITPLLIFSSPINMIIFQIPLIGMAYLWLVNLFGKIISL